MPIDTSDQFIVAVAAIILKENKLLMMKRAATKDAGPNLWEGVSGRVNHQEDPYDAVLREIEEECGLIVEVEKRPVDLYMTKRLGKPMLLIVYKANYLSGKVVLCEEHSEYLWGTLEEFKEKTTVTRLVQAVETAFEQERTSSID